MTEQQLDLSHQGDQVFSALAREFPAARKWRLLFEQRLEARRFEAIRAALLGYLAAVMEVDAVLGEDEALQLLLERRAQLVNYTRGGMLAPTREHSVAWNALHRSLVRALEPYAMGDHIDGIDLPVNVRLVYGDIDPAREQAPFSSTKLHSDVWAGIPADASVVVLPVLGDIDNITIECFEMARADEFAALRALRDYDEGKHVQPVVAYRDCSMQHGHLYVADARLLHRTIRKKRAGVRLSLDFRFRYNDAAYRAGAPMIARGGPDSVDTRVPFATWAGVGSERLIVFADSMDDLRRKKDASSSPVNTARYRLVELADASGA